MDYELSAFLESFTRKNFRLPTTEEIKVTLRCDDSELNKIARALAEMESACGSQALELLQDDGAFIDSFLTTVKETQGMSEDQIRVYLLNKIKNFAS